MAVPEINSSFVYRGQSYRLLDSVPHVNRWGFATCFLRWQTTCPDCGQSFVATTSRRGATVQSPSQMRLLQGPGEAGEGSAMSCAIDRIPMAHQWRNLPCAINTGAICKNPMAQWRTLGFSQWRANGAMAHE